MTLTLAGEPLIAYLLASVRIVAWLAIVPPFSSRAVPAMAKVVLSLGLAFAVTPAMTGGIPVGFAELAINVVTQVLIGAGMGFVTYLLFQAIATAGSLIDMFGGFALAQGFDPLGLHDEHGLRQVPPDARHDAAVRERRPPAGDRRTAADLRVPPARHQPRRAAARPTCWSRRSGCSSPPRSRSRCR